MDLTQIETAINKTGYVLENNVYQILKEHGWSVISNKYYIDDFTESVREIDLIAYKVSKKNDYLIYTAIILSCKKSEENIWALISRNPDRKDPNANWYPLHVWTNITELNFQISQENFPEKFHQESLNDGTKQILSIPTQEIFSFQEISALSGANKNDKNIYASIQTLMKSQHYEISKLPNRKTEKCIYQFNLVSIADTDLIITNLEKGTNSTSIKCTYVDTAPYLTSYIINREDSYSRIQFTTFDHFEELILEYNELHLSNCNFFAKQYDDFYENIQCDYKKLTLLKNLFLKDLGHRFEYLIHDQFDIEKCDDIDFSWNKKESILSIDFILDVRRLESANQNEELRDIVSKSLNNIYKYTGDFIFGELILF